MWTINNNVALTGKYRYNHFPKNCDCIEVILSILLKIKRSIGANIFFYILLIHRTIVVYRIYIGIIIYQT